MNKALFMSDIITDKNPFHFPICGECKHFTGSLKCKAFDKIPIEILSGENDHEKPLPGQKGDFVFTPKDK